MKTTKNKELRKQARESLKGLWGISIAVTVIYAFIIIVVEFIPFIGGFISLFISGAMTTGLCYFAIAVSRRNNPDVPLLFYGFKKYWITFAGYILLIIFIGLWSLIGIIPGLIGFGITLSPAYETAGAILIILSIFGLIPSIIASLAYSQTFFIIADQEIGPFEAIVQSIHLMKGHKWKLIWLYLSFIWWLILSILTFGIGLLWFFPYFTVSTAKFYDDIRNVNMDKTSSPAPLSEANTSAEDI